ncbi:class I SAM-dependent methyltransferase [Paenibacillus aurantiacus]|uniref:Class I SAM-dependent methyltransferase n=1 Tax=Paenibacillus aurantiacus TaxID=1936118 RepID=A0ABV5KKX7_9BACL
MASIQSNQDSWNTGAYAAWVSRFGTPSEAAGKMTDDPAKRLGAAMKHLGDVRGKRIANLLGSNGAKAVPLALLGAEVTVIDFSADNQRYALELAEAAGAEIRYVLSDVLQLPEEQFTGEFDIVYMEHGILHYFQDLRPLFRVVHRLLRLGGQLVLQDFHPVTTKLISSRGTTANIRKHKVDGDYFSAELEEKDVAFAKFLPAGSAAAAPKVQLRNWTLGEIVTAVAGEELTVRVLEELPNLSSDVFDKGIPKTFTLTAERR